MKSPALLLSLALCSWAALPPLAAAQSVCSSDKQLRAVQLTERFINADCASCWADPITPSPSPGTLVLDWVTPGAQGDDAPLSAVASVDGLNRLMGLGQSAPTAVSAYTTAITPDAALTRSTLRVARGLAVSGYIGASISLKPAPTHGKPAAMTAWLALVETLPAGLEGSPVARNLVRNVFQSTWNLPVKLLKTEQNQLFEQRSMSVSSGVNPERLQVIGWLTDERGRVLAAAQSVCNTAAP